MAVAPIPRPPLSVAEEGWIRQEKRSREATKIRAAGVVLAKFYKFY